jgi:transposase
LEYLKQNPYAKINDVCLFFRSIFQSRISKSSASSFLKKLGWNWRVPTRFQINKYSFNNLYYYTQYIESITKLPFEKIKFVDESHVVSKDLHSKRILGIKGRRRWTKENSLHQPSLSLTLLTSLSNNPSLFIDIRVESNTQWDFAEFILQACVNGYLVPGDFLVIDNASIHAGIESVDTLIEILNNFGVKLMKLPTYSPELNPCELVFAQMKRYIRNNKRLENLSDLTSILIESLSMVRKENLENYYKKCICPKVILPEFFST